MGDSHVLVVTGSETDWAGGINSSGQVGDGTTTARKTPVLLSISNVTKVAAHLFPRAQSDGSVWAWGRQNVGQIGTTCR